MTAAQKKNVERFKKAAAEAKKLRKKNPKLTQAQAVKQAYAILYKTGKVAAVKKTATKKPARKKATAKSYHKDTKSHNVRINVVSGYQGTTRKGKKTTVHYSRISGMPTYKDPDAAREIELFADNDSQLYFQQRRPILINLGKKYKKGTYDISKAAKLWRYYIDSAMKKYHKEFGTGKDWHKLLSTHDRQLLALELAQQTKDEFDLGNFTN